MNLPQKKAPEAWMTGNLFAIGIGHVIIARYKGSGDVEVGVFLVDTFCLGVKDSLFRKFDGSEFEPALEDMLRGNKKSITPAYARKLIEASVAYAGKLGLAPHADYKKACKVLGGIVASDCNEEITLGSNGQPCYMQGPHDSPARVHQILRLLTANCGEGNFGFTRELFDEEFDSDTESADGHDHVHVHGPGCGHDHAPKASR